MTEDERAHVLDAILAIVAQTVKQIAERAGVPQAKTKKVLKRLVAAGDVEQRGHHYRYAHAGPWLVAREPIPVNAQVRLDGDRPEGFSVLVPEPTPAPSPPGVASLARQVLSRSTR